jgi:hypothetical protein
VRANQDRAAFAVVHTTLAASPEQLRAFRQQTIADWKQAAEAVNIRPK